MKFVQIVEYTTSRIDEVQAVLDEFLAENKGQLHTRGMKTRDRDRPNTYLDIVEFPSYEVAMKNSESAATQAFGEKMMKLTDGPPTFRNLDVIHED